MTSRIQLRPSQKEAIRRALQYPGFCLFMEQRTGKTHPACAIAEARKPKRLLIACPLIAIVEWEETLKHYDLGNCDIRIINYEGWWAQRRKLKQWQPDGIIADETHRVKNRKSKVSKALRGVGICSQWRLALTGTPTDGASAEQWEDIWAQYDFIDPTVFGKWKDFAERYLRMGGFMGKKVVGINALREEELLKKFQSRFYRVTLEEIKEQKTEIQDVVVRFDLEETRPYYEAMEQKFMVDLEDMHGYQWTKVVDVDGQSRFKRTKKKIIAPRVITQAMKLHQLSGGFILGDQGEVNHVGDEKLAYCGALIDQLGRVPIAIFVRFIPELYRIAALCRAMNRTVLLVSGSHKYVKGSFTTDVVITQIRSALSTDYSRAQHAIFYSWNYSHADHHQARFRIRSFTSSQAKYYYLIANNTIDEDLLDVITGKAQNFSQLLINRYRR